LAALQNHKAIFTNQIVSLIPVQSTAS